MGADVGVIGGSGFYEFLPGAEAVRVATPYGEASGPVVVGEVDGRSVAFLARHGGGHVLPPHRVNYRANMWALHNVGVRRVVAPSAAGSLKASIEPGHFVVLDQLVDRTRGRADTYFDGPDPRHVAFADPYCAELSPLVAESARAEGLTVHGGGTVVVVQGPRFSTRAESAWFRSMGWDVVNMTQYPEAVLARELGMCYAGIALVTDYDTGVEGRGEIAPVTMDQVFAVLDSMVEATRRVLMRVLPAISADRKCTCGE